MSLTKSGIRWVHTHYNKIPAKQTELQSYTDNVQPSKKDVK
jgi:hypothetical protein